VPEWRRAEVRAVDPGMETLGFEKTKKKLTPFRAVSFCDTYRTYRNGMVLHIKCVVNR
jgi:hypothetical protein